MFNAEGAAIAPPERHPPGCPERGVIRKTDDDVPWASNDAQRLLERLTDVGKVLDDLERDDGIYRPIAKWQLQRIAGNREKRRLVACRCCL